MPPIILGDSAYPLLKWLIKPFSDNGQLSSPTKEFNYRLSRARIVIENAFGRLKGRWRCLLKRNDINLQNLPNVVAACATLHNMCEIYKEQFNDEWSTNTDADNNPLDNESDPAEVSTTIDILHLIGIGNGSRALKYACFDFHTECFTMIPFLSFIRGLDTRQTNKSVLMIVEKL